VPGPRILDTDTYTFPTSLDAMGFDLRETGFHILLSKDVPQLIKERIGGLTDTFLARSGLARSDVATFLLHPGGQKLLSYVQEELGLCRCDTELSWEVLDQYGNLSSATILFIIHAFLTRKTPQPGDYGIAAAFGPGFSAELLLLQWP
jgi:alkylresorcinol/alkylpyrone synthase